MRIGFARKSDGRFVVEEDWDGVSRSRGVAS